MADNEAQQERRSDTVAIPRSTFKAASWVASLAFTGVAYFVWNSGSAVHDVDAELNILELRVDTLEGFARAGGRFTEADGQKLETRVDKMAEKLERHIKNIEEKIDGHKDLQAHREQTQLNREIFWRLQKLEKPNSDNWNHNE